jgi:serine/threonine protein kinase
MLFGENPFNEEDNIISDRSLRDLMDTSGCTVVIGQDCLPLGEEEVGGRKKKKPVVKLTQDCFDLVSGLLTRDPARRMTMATILTHPWWLSNDVIIDGAGDGCV